MIDPAWFIMGVAVPGLLAQAFYVTYCWPLKNPRPGRVASAWAIGPGAGFVLGAQAVGGFSAGSAEQRFFLFVLPVIVLVAVVGAMGWLKGRMWDAAKLLVCIAAPAFLFSRMYLGESTQWSPGVAAAWLAALPVCLAVAWLGVAKLDQDENGRLNAFVVGLTAALTGVTLIFSGSLKFGQIAATLAFATGTVWAVSWLTPRAQASRGFEGVVTPVILCWLMLAFFFTEMPGWQVAVLAMSPLLLWLQKLPFIKVRKLKGQIAVGAVALAPVVTVLVMAGMEFAHRMQESEW